MKTISGAPIQTSQGPGPITAFTGAPAGGLVHVTTAGTLGVTTGNYVFASGTVQFPNIQLTAVAGTTSGITLRTGASGLGTSARWNIQKNNSAEGGADTGAALIVIANSDAGVTIDTPVSILRAAAGVITLGGGGRPITLALTNQGLRINGQVTGAGVAAGTLLNAPSAGNPAFWLPVDIAGAMRYIPCWS